ncbi:MAG: hypothetical protein Q9186_006098 [Xanthomendoza sp. 1 TL-2023]
MSVIVPRFNEGGVFDIIAKEVGVTRDEVLEAEDFADLGIDDVLSSFIIRRINETSKLELPQTTFQDYQSAPDLEAYLESVSSPPSPRLQPNRPNQPNGTKKPTYPQSAPAVKPTSATARTSSKGPLSILLQGKPSTSQKTVFLLPDGSGSAMVYSRFPRISPDVCVIGMNSPFLNAATDFGTTIEDLALTWTAEIRKRQPDGPYILGGYSAGGYYSFEVAKQLQREGETVEKLIIMDSPCRTVFEALPMEVISFLAKKRLLGNWGSKSTPDWFINHFQGTIDAVERYTPTPMDEDESVPECFIVWATDGVIQGKMDPRETGLDLSVKITQFMLNDKQGFGLHGWEQLLPTPDANVIRVPGNHFSMVHPPNVRHLTPR